MNLHKTMSLPEALRYARTIDCRFETSGHKDRVQVFAPLGVAIEPDQVVVAAGNAPIGHFVRWLKRLNRILYERELAEGATTPIVVASRAPGPIERGPNSVKDISIVSRVTAQVVARQLPPVPPRRPPPPVWNNRSLEQLRRRIAGQRKGSPS